MKKLTFIYLTSSFFFFAFCKQNTQTSNENIKIQNRNFNFQNDRVNKFVQQVQIINNDQYKLFVYKSEGTNDSLKIFKNNQIYFKNVLLTKLDTKIVKRDKDDFSLSKYYFEDQKDYRGDCIFFINIEDGFVFSESLNSGYVTEYNVKKYHDVHKSIALRKLGFKKNKFELQFAKMDYPELQE